MRQITLACVLMVLIAVTCLAQEKPIIEYGSPDELKGVTKIFIDTGTELEVRSNIIKELDKNKKKAPNLVVVNSPEEAEFILVYSASSSSFLSGVTTNPPIYQGGTATSTPTYRRVISGNGYVVKPLDSNKVRIIMDFKDRRSTIFEKRPSTNFAREFIKAYVNANSDTKSKD